MLSVYIYIYITEYIPIFVPNRPLLLDFIVQRCMEWMAKGPKIGKIRTSCKSNDETLKQTKGIINTREKERQSQRERNREFP